MISFVTFRTDTGKITQVSTCPDDFFADMPAFPAGYDHLTIPGPPADIPIFILDHYVSDGQVRAKMAMTPSVSTDTIAADGHASCVIADLPNPCVVTISGALAAGPETIDDGTALVLTCDHPGDLIVRITAEPAYLYWSTIIHAV